MRVGQDTRSGGPLAVLISHTPPTPAAGSRGHVHDDERLLNTAAACCCSTRGMRPFSGVVH